MRITIGNKELYEYFATQIPERFRMTVAKGATTIQGMGFHIKNEEVAKSMLRTLRYIYNKLGVESINLQANNTLMFLMLNRRKDWDASKSAEELAVRPLQHYRRALQFTL